MHDVHCAGFDAHAHARDMEFGESPSISFDALFLEHVVLEVSMEFFMINTVYAKVGIEFSVDITSFSIRSHKV